jgi:hypothetical protein
VSIICALRLSVCVGKGTHFYRKTGQNSEQISRAAIAIIFLTIRKSLIYRCLRKSYKKGLKKIVKNDTPYQKNV